MSFVRVSPCDRVSGRVASPVAGATDGPALKLSAETPEKIWTVTVPAPADCASPVPPELTLSARMDESSPGERALIITANSPAGCIAEARMALPGSADGVIARRTRNGLSLQVRCAGAEGKKTFWHMRLMAHPQEGVIEVIERATAVGLSWRMRFTGTRVHTHQQLVLVSQTAESAHFRTGGFTQHGQLFDLKDWFLVENSGICSGFLLINPGQWRAPASPVCRVSGDAGGVELHVPLQYEGVVKRRFLLAQAPAATALRIENSRIAYFDSEQGHADWPARLIARYGFARTSRLAANRQRVERLHLQRPAHFLLGADGAVDAAFARIAREPELAGAFPFWHRDFSGAREWVIKTLRRFHQALTEKGYLHPLGNPVACRVLAPTCAAWHLLDVAGALSDADRHDAAVMLSDIAEMAASADFYPHHMAMQPPEIPYTERSLYRGMLNQNFHTDCYVLAGLVGCLMPEHPRAAFWRRHAIRQFERQMACFVWPGGAWEESHTYANHVKLCLLPLVLALRRAPEHVDLMQNPQFQQMCHFFVPLLSPPEDARQHRRAIPAIGDHGYQLTQPDYYSFIFGWLAALDPQRRDDYLWAWRETGGKQSDAVSEQIAVFAPLLSPLKNDAAHAPTPDLPALLALPGYGAVARRNTGAADESLLVVRCGESWGHYHPDQGSFWWWHRRRLICTDADLGNGTLKHAHTGHNVLGYPGRAPMQYMDRVPYHVDQCEQSGACDRIRCQIPVYSWEAGRQRDEAIPPENRPHVTRTLAWHCDGTLVIQDASVRSPEGKVTWSLHVLAQNARRTGGRNIEFVLGPDGSRLQVQLPVEPLDILLEPCGATWRLQCTYPEMPLEHRLTACMMNGR